MSKLIIKRPNIKNHIGIYYGGMIDSTILEDKPIQELLSLSGDFDFAMNYTYAIYSDSNQIQESMMLPIFHSYYLNSDPKMIILRNLYHAIDIIELYSYHRFYIYTDQNNAIDTHKQFTDRFPKVSIELINSIKDII